MYKLTGPDVHMAYRHAVPLRFDMTPEWEKTPEDWRAICAIMAAHLNSMIGQSPLRDNPLRDNPLEPRTDEIIAILMDKSTDKETWH